MKTKRLSCISFIVCLLFSFSSLTSAEISDETAKQINSVIQEEIKNTVNYFKEDSLKTSIYGPAQQISLLNETTNERSIHEVVLVEAHFQTERDSIFHFQKREIFYYDVNENNLIFENLALHSKTFAEIEQTINEEQGFPNKPSPWNTVYMILFLTIMCTIPLFLAKTKNHLART